MGIVTDLMLTAGLAMIIVSLLGGGASVPREQNIATQPGEKKPGLFGRGTKWTGKKLWGGTKGLTKILALPLRPPARTARRILLGKTFGEEGERLSDDVERFKTAVDRIDVLLGAVQELADFRTKFEPKRLMCE